MLVFFQEFGGDIGGKVDDASVHLLLDSTPSKVISNEMTVSLKRFLMFVTVIAIDRILFYFSGEYYIIIE